MEHTAPGKKQDTEKEFILINYNQLKIKIMRKQLNGLLSELRTEQLEILTTIVKETLAVDCRMPKVNVFTAAQLWNIQRQGKSRIQRRLSF